MKLYFSFLLFLGLISCKYSYTTKYDLESAMQSHLYSRVNNDSSKVKYRIDNVEFFDDKEKDRYICEFTVNMHELSAEGKTTFDTTGIMKAYISKDFKKVIRLY